MPRNQGQDAQPYIFNPPWDDKNKKTARQLSIIDFYREMTGLKSVPRDRQYWTLAGSYRKSDGSIIKGELGHLLEEGFIVKSQFHGIDRNDYTIAQNREIHSDIADQWHEGEMVDVLREVALSGGDFNPAIINFDGTNQIERGCAEVSSLLYLLDNIWHEDLLLFVNLAMNASYRSEQKIGCKMVKGVVGSDIIIQHLIQKHVFAKHWKVWDCCYQYPGSGSRSQTRMCTFMFVKEPHVEIEYETDYPILINRLDTMLEFC